jgi:hypothetical protein
MSNVLELTGLKRAERFVSEQHEAGSDIRWEGWDIVFFRPSELGRTSKQGVIRDGVYGFDNRVVVDSDGVWRVDFRNVKRTKRTRGSRN